ncbi:unnamed protein product [Vicia faba]|uniref:Pentatricopeptide repeat (PPR) superfamily protein n=1 Tax=Vicia faba TaxID=3906 RepID=A0AAV0ZCU0_VICFA|nr:unnamed protein product [Vicia faba]
MIIIDPPIVARFHLAAAATATTRFSSATLHNNRSMWNAEDVNGGLGYAPSCRLACSCGFDAPWIRSKKYSGNPFTRRNKLVKNRIGVSSEHPGSDQEPVKKSEKSSYHPFEEIAASTLENNGDDRLTAAETSRTVIEVNSKATMVFSSFVSDEFHENLVWPDLPYLTDEHGNIYFQAKNGEDILQSLTSENNFVQVIIGVDTMEMISEMDLSGPSEIDFGIEEIDDQDTDDLDGSDEEDEDENEDENVDYDSEWPEVLSDEDEQEDDDETLADWAKFETMRLSHPMDFAKKLAEIASDDPIDWMQQPPACVVFQGVLRPAFIEENSPIQKHLSANQSSDAEISKVTENKEESIGAINGHELNTESSEDNASQQVEDGNSDIPSDETSFYRLEMVKIQVFSAHGHPIVLELEDYAKAQPDAIARSSSKIISHLKAGGEKTLLALKSLCCRSKGIKVEEAQLICVDSLGFDIRVCSGTQVQTLRFGFKKRATSEYSAERQLNDLLFPRNHPKQPKTKQTHQNEC